jgi:hypothetical protein
MLKCSNGDIYKGCTEILKKEQTRITTALGIFGMFLMEKIFPRRFCKNSPSSL